VAIESANPDVGGRHVLDDCSKRNPLESFSKFETTFLASFELTKILQLRQHTGMTLNIFLNCNAMLTQNIGEIVTKQPACGWNGRLLHFLGIPLID
jgi:hypothetical protein